MGDFPPIISALFSSRATTTAVSSSGYISSSCNFVTCNRYLSLFPLQHVCCCSFCSLSFFPFLNYFFLSHSSEHPRTTRYLPFVLPCFRFPFLISFFCSFSFYSWFPSFFTKAFSGFCFVVFSYPVR